MKNQSCVHAWCRMAAKSPQYFGLFKSNYLMKRAGIKSFSLARRVIDDNPYLLPINPYRMETAKHETFEIFRQAQTSHCEAAGYWPTGRDVFNKAEVAFVFMETIVLGTPDLKEVAIYTGEGSTARQSGSTQ